MFSATMSALASILSAVISALASILSAASSVALWLQALSATIPAASASVVVIFIIFPWLQKTAVTKRTTAPISSERVTGLRWIEARDLSRRARRYSGAAGARDPAAVDPGGVLAERQHRLEAVPAVRRNRAAAKVVKDVEAASDANQQHGDRPADLVLADHQIEVAGRNAESPQRLHFDDRPVLHVPGAVLQRLRRARPIIVQAPFGRVGNPADLVGHRGLDVSDLLFAAEASRRRHEPPHRRQVRRIEAGPAPAGGVAIGADRKRDGSEQVGGSGSRLTGDQDGRVGNDIGC